MRIIDLITMASGNIFRSKLRTFLTIIAVCIGSFTLTLTTGLGAGISSYIDKQVNNLGAKDVLIILPSDNSVGLSGDSSPKKYDPNKKVSASGLPRPGGGTRTVLTDADVTKIKAVIGIKSVDPAKSVAPDYITGSNGDKYETSISQFIAGSNLTLDAGSQVNPDASRNEVILPSNYTSSLGYGSAQSAVGKIVTIAISDALGRQHTTTAVIVGVQQKGLAGGGGLTVDRALLNQLDAFQVQGFPTASSDKYQLAYAKFDPSYSEQKINDLKSRLKTLGYSASTIEDQIGTFKVVIAGIIAVLDAFAIIALLAASFGIINTLLMSVQERTREIGLMKAMGMSGIRIFVLFSLEAISLGFWGSAIGVVIAEVVGQVANKVVSNGFLKDLTGLQLLTFTTQNIVEIIALVVAIAFVAGTLPAWRAARQNPIDALRYE